jgi:hypothetical protein
MGEAVVIEVIRQLITLAYSIAQTNNLSEEELENLRKASYEEVKKRDPNNLPEV